MPNSPLRCIRCTQCKWVAGGVGGKPCNPFPDKARRRSGAGWKPALRNIDSAPSASRHDAVAALVLRLEEFLVRRADDLVGRQRLAAAGGRQADADRHQVALAFVLEQVLLDLAADALGDVDAALVVRLRQHDGELLAAVARE